MKFVIDTALSAMSAVCLKLFLKNFVVFISIFSQSLFPLETYFIASLLSDIASMGPTWLHGWVLVFWAQKCV